MPRKATKATTVFAPLKRAQILVRYLLFLNETFYPNDYVGHRIGFLVSIRSITLNISKATCGTIALPAAFRDSFRHQESKVLSPFSNAFAANATSCGRD